MSIASEENINEDIQEVCFDCRLLFENNFDFSLSSSF
jgi:hypothetical protein